MLGRRNYLTALGTVTPLSFIGRGPGEFIEPYDGDPETVVAAHVEAGATGDSTQLRAGLHSENPINLSNIDMDEMKAAGESGPGWMYHWAAFDDYEVSLIEYGVDLATVYDIPSMKRWYKNRADLEATLAGETGALVDVTFEQRINGEVVEESLTYLVLTEDGEWTVFAEYEEFGEIPDSPAQADAYPIVEEITLEPNSDRPICERAGMATIRVSNEVDTEEEVEEIRVYSTNLETYGHVTMSESVCAQEFTALFDKNGDQLVISAVAGGEEVVVQRETFRPQ